MEPLQWIFISSLIITLFWASVKLYRRRRALVYTLKHDLARGHRWLSTEFNVKPTYCNSCMQFCVSGHSCEMCGVCICPNEKCTQSASATHTCKSLTLPKSGGPMSHSWVRGNLPLSSTCFKCFNPCGNMPALADFRCVWCQTTVHEECVKGDEWNNTPCSLGPHRRLIIPPDCLDTHQQNWRKRLVVRDVRPPDIERWCPLLVLANPKSGGKNGEVVMSLLRRLLNPIQVVNVLEVPPDNALELCRLLPSTTVKVLVCGGDGTVGWVLGCIDKANLPELPQVAVLPLGTGNDLARVLGWGVGYSTDDNMEEILKEVEHSQCTMFDRWKVTIDSRRRYLGLHRNPKSYTMNNYLGVGCDAGVALNFHRQRESRPELFTSRLINKAWYVGYGARDVIEQLCKNLNSKIELYLDDHLTKLPELEGVVILNINSWSSGCTVWPDPTHNDDWKPSRMDDKLLEVIGLYSSFHIGKIQVSVAEPLRIGQAETIKIVLKESIPIQIDGEPWQQGPCMITISHQGQAKMLKKVS